MASEQRTVLLPTLFVMIRNINNQHDAGALGCAAAAIGSDRLSRRHVWPRATLFTAANGSRSEPADHRHEARRAACSAAEVR